MRALLSIFGFLVLTPVHIIIILTFTQDASASDRVKRFVELARIDPLYAWPGVDLKEMKLAIKALEGSRAEILSFSDQYTDEQKQRISTSLYPISYLNEMITLEELRRGLLKASDIEALAAYQKQLLITIDQHLAHLKSLHKNLKRTASEAQHKGLAFHFGRSSFAHFLNGISTYRNDAQQNLSKAKNRWQCLQAEVVSCDEHPVWHIVEPPEDRDYSLDVFNTQPARITHNIRRNGRLGGNFSGSGWAVLNQADCYSGKTAIPYLTWEFPTASGVPIFRPEVVSDVYVHDHQIDEQSNAYERILHSLGMKGFLFQPHTNLYACPDAAGDSAKLRAMIYVYEFAKSMNLQMSASEQNKLKTSFEKLAQSTYGLRETTILTEDDILAYMRQVTGLLANFDHNQLAMEIGQEQLEAFETLALAYRLKTPFLSRDVMNLVFANTAIGDYVPYASWGFLEELLFTRSGPELLLGGTNQSIVKENYSQTERYRKGISPRLRSYVHDLSQDFSEEKITEILIMGLNAEYRLAKFQKRPYLFAE